MDIVKNKNLEFYRRSNNQNIVFDRKTKKSYTLGDDEFRILDMLDEDATMDGILQEFPKFSSKDIKNLVQVYGKHGLLEGGSEKKFKLADLLKMKLPLVNLERYKLKENGILPILYRLILYCSIPVFFIGLIMVLFTDFNVNIVPEDYVGIKTAIVFVLLSAISISLHELSHGLAGKMNNAVVPEIGLMLYFFIPCAYTTICGMSSVKDKKGKIIVVCAGVLLNLLLSGVAMILMAVFRSNETAIVILILALLANIIPIIANGIIFLKWDSYYLVSILLEEPQLYEKSGVYVDNILKGVPQEKNLMFAGFGFTAAFYAILTVLSFGFSMFELVKHLW